MVAPTSTPDRKVPPSGAAWPAISSSLICPFEKRKTPSLKKPLLLLVFDAAKAICPALLMEVVKGTLKKLPSGRGASLGIRTESCPLENEKIPESAIELEIPPNTTCPESLRVGGSAKPKGTPSGIISPAAMILVRVPPDKRKMPFPPVDRNASNATWWD